MSSAKPLMPDNRPYRSAPLRYVKFPFVIIRAAQQLMPIQIDIHAMLREADNQRVHIWR